jgi:hypothetical protein
LRQHFIGRKYSLRSSIFENGGSTNFKEKKTWQSQSENWIDIGVFKIRKKCYQARVRYGGTMNSLGTFDNKEQAGIAYDRFVVDKSTEEVSFTLNYPKMTDLEREEALKVEEPKPIQEKCGIPNPTRLG